jgi:hypothetical protein
VLIRTATRTPVRSALAVAGAAAGLLVLAGCSGGSSPAASAAGQSGAGAATTAAAAAGAGSGGVHQFQGVLTVTGATSQSAKFTEPLEELPSCADLAQSGEQGTWSIPSSDSSTFTFGINAAPYKGPGTYTAMSTFSNSTWLTAAGQEWEPVAASTGSLTVKADGSGSFTFTDLQNDYTPGPAASGTVTWTCS